MSLAITGQMLKGLADFLLPVVGICLLIFVVLVAPKVKNGTTSLKDAIIGVVGFLLLGGIMVFASVNFQDTSSGTNRTVQKVVDNAADQAAKNANNVLNGNGK